MRPRVPAAWALCRLLLVWCGGVLLVQAAARGCLPALPEGVIDAVVLLLGMPLLWWKVVLPLHLAVRGEQSRRDAIVDHAAEGIITITADGIIEGFNHRAETIFGHASAETLGRNVTMLMPPAYRLTHNDHLQNYQRTGIGKILGRSRELVGQRKDGSVFSMELHVSAVTIGARPLFTGIILDITERKQAEEQLRLRDRAIEAISQGIVITDACRPGQPIIFVNTAFEKLTGYSAEEALGRAGYFLHGPGTEAAAVEKLDAAVAHTEVCTVELLDYRKDGTSFWNVLSVSPLRDEAGTVTLFVWVLTDATERKHLEEQFRQSQKLEAIGRLAGGIAHDFNNLLTLITGYSSLLLETMKENDPARGSVQQIKKAGHRAAELTGQLLAFSRKQVLAPKVFDLNDVIADMEKMLRRLIREDIDLCIRLPADLWPVKADPHQASQAIINLAVNARDAMPQGGQLTIETANVILDETYAGKNPEVRPGAYVLCALSDSGCGMDEATKARIFEPFFTTKDVGKGTGLGLAMVFGIVKQSAGHIAVYSEPGHGTTVKVYWPRAEIPASSAAAPPPPPPRPLPRGSETVLVAEDDPALRDMVHNVLTRSGYSVLSAEDGAAAIRLGQSHSGPIHLLLTDVIMPHFSGRQLADNLLSRHPLLKTLYISGYTHSVIARRGVLENTTPFLQKPFPPDALVHKVRDVLDQR